jgi:Domain of unknown function (DUF3854)
MNLESVLRSHHLDQLLKGSGLSPDVIVARGYRSIEGPEGYSELKRLGFSRLQARNASGLLIPIWTPDGRNGSVLYRPDTPRQDLRGRAIKYEIPKNAGIRLDCSPLAREQLKDPHIALWITEGIKKGDALASHGLCAIDLLGVWNFKGKNAFGGVAFLADWDQIALNSRQVRIVLDSDVNSKLSARKALERLREHLQRRGAHVTTVYLQPQDGRKVGVDDYLLHHTVEELEGLIEAPRPQPQPAAPVIELLEEESPRLTRLLAYIEGNGYAATWLPTRTTVTEQLGKDGEVERLAHPQVSEVQRLFIVRDDGVRFGEVSDPKVTPLTELKMAIQLTNNVPRRLLWSTKGLVAYSRWGRPEPKDVFARLTAMYDHFLDFSRSLDERPRMCRFSACCSLMTWFIEVFTVLPYVWPNSPTPGAGKTKCGHCWTKTAYLGHLTSASGSFAALRDLADLGATLMFDDAEVLADPRKADPDKMALILAGNRRGVEVPVKEPSANGGWRTRWVNAYCPRGFTALNLPFRALQSRSIVIPLVASADPTRANRDPENPDDWPLDQKQLRDDLWAVALALQREAAAVWTDMSKETSILGRDWERWRALMAVARLFERHGVEGLEQDIRRVMASYHQQKGGLETQSREMLVIRALMRLAKLKDVDVWTTLDIMDVSSETLKVTASQVAQAVKGLLTEADDGTDDEEPSTWVNARSVGRILSKLRLQEERGEPPKRERYRHVVPKDVAQLALAHHLVHLSDETSITSTDVQMSSTEPENKGEVI